ncbi:uncharacterized protein LOC127812549 [Diospyros lotus]|uniref:uncharacterized protein LOC127812549 n=1 Tax=Diospyros lotus TaxID=55363 RepID=UPI002254736B|nr:uncharacterized protein LOC127812549 [Diospyros lotus]
MSSHNHSSPLASCFRPTTADHQHSAVGPPSSPISGNANLTTCVYHTDLGLFDLTWSRSSLGRSLHLHLLPAAATGDDAINISPSFRLHIKPFIFWKKHGSKKLPIANTKKTFQIFWDLSRAKFGSQPEPQSGFYIAVVFGGEMILLVGDSPAEAYAKSRASKPLRADTMVLRREHMYGNKLYTTKASFGGKTRDISIDCRTGDDPRLYFSVDHKRVLQVKHLKWKFRGNERIEIDGVSIQVSWDVYNWLFEDDEDRHALFMFRFEKQGFEDDEDRHHDHQLSHHLNEKNGMAAFWSQQSSGPGYEKKKRKKSLLRTARSSSSSSLSSASSSCSSVMEWASAEENELKGPSDFSLLIYAWKS